MSWSMVTRQMLHLRLLLRRWNHLRTGRSLGTHQRLNLILAVEDYPDVKSSAHGSDPVSPS